MDFWALTVEVALSRQVEASQAGNFANRGYGFCNLVLVVSNSKDYGQEFMTSKCMTAPRVQIDFR